MTLTNGDFDQKFQKFWTKSEFFPMGKFRIQLFRKYDKFISLELHLRKFWATSILTKKVTPTSGDFDQKFWNFETKSDVFPIGKIGITNFPKLKK